MKRPEFYRSTNLFYC